MSGKTGIGLIGCGLMGRIHAWELSQHADADGVPIVPVAAADPSADARQKVAETWDFASLHDSADAVLANPEVDALWICTPTFTHRDLVAAALASGKHVYCEKPLAPRIEIVRELRDLAAESGLVCQVGFESRWQAIPRFIRLLLDSGELGSVMGYVQRSDEVFPATSFNPNVSEWRANVEQTGGGALIEHSIHEVDLLCWMFGPATHVAAATRSVLGREVEDTAALTITHESGVVGTLMTIWNRMEGRDENRFEIFSENGTVEATWGGVVLDAPQNGIRVHRGDGKAAPDAPLITADYLSARGLHKPFFWARVADAAFLRAVRSGSESPCDFDAGLTAHAVVDAAYRSAATGETVAVADGQTP